MTDILFLAHRIPYPPNKGDKIRSWHILEYLSQRARVHLGCFVDDPKDEQYESHLRQIVGGRCCFVRLDPTLAKIRSARGLMSGQSLSVEYYHAPGLKEWAQQVADRYNVRRLFLFSGVMAPFAWDLMPTRRTVMDFVDIDSDKWRQYAREKPWPMNRIYEREARALADLEHRTAARATTSLFVSQAEATLFRRSVGSAGHSVQALPNGVDHALFDPAHTPPLAADQPPLPGSPKLLFTGAMDYWPNEDAVDWFCHQVLPLVRQSQPGAHFSIVGSRPSKRVRALAKMPGVSVTGAVDKMPPYLAAADVVVAPLRIARGIQNKVLEAMAMARPVVASPEAFEGIEATPGVHLEVAAGPTEMRRAIDRLLADPVRAASMGRAARALVQKRYDWPQNLAALDVLLDLPQRALAAVAAPEEVALRRRREGII